MNVISRNYRTACVDNSSMGFVVPCNVVAIVNEFELPTIGGSKGDAPDTPPPNFFSFSCSFSEILGIIVC